MTREQQERVAREILGWSYDDAWNLMPKHAGPLWLWPLETALMERGWEFRIHMNRRWEAIQGFDDASRDTHAEVVNAAALIEIGEKP